MIKPIDIQNKDFEKKIKGYDIEQVDDFLEAILHDYEFLCNENKALRDKNSEIQEALDRYKLMDITLKQSVTVAQKNADEIINAAKLEAQNIIEKAKLDAKKEQREAEEAHMRKHHELLSLKTQISEYKLKIKALSEGIIKTLDEE